MERSDIRVLLFSAKVTTPRRGLLGHAGGYSTFASTDLASSIPDFATLNPGYLLCGTNEFNERAM